MLRFLIFVLAFIAGPAAAATRCAIEPAGAEQRVVVADAGRPMTVHLPAGFDPATPAPLVVLLHGSGATGAAMLRDSGLAQAADRHGFIVAAPDAGIVHERGFVWNIPGVPTVAGRVPGPGDRDDVAYLTRAVEGLVAQGCVDGARVYVTGLSGGGRMASWLGCVAAGRFAAIAPVVGLRAGRPMADDLTRPDPATCRPARAVPVMAFAGDKDTTNPLRGGAGARWGYSMHAAEQRWAALNGCTAAPVTRWVAAGVYEERYSGCRAGADVAGRITVGGGHSWVADNDVMWAFFAQHRR